MKQDISKRAKELFERRGLNLNWKRDHLIGKIFEDQQGYHVHSIIRSNKVTRDIPQLINYETLEDQNLLTVCNHHRSIMRLTHNGFEESPINNDSEKEEVKLLLICHGLNPVISKYSEFSSNHQNIIYKQAEELLDFLILNKENGNETKIILLEDIHEYASLGHLFYQECLVDDVIFTKGKQKGELLDLNELNLLKSKIDGTKTFILGSDTYEIGHVVGELELINNPQNVFVIQDGIYNHPKHIDNHPNAKIGLHPSKKELETDTYYRGTEIITFDDLRQEINYGNRST